MTDNEIIKALECCISRTSDRCRNRECPYFNRTQTYIYCKKLLKEEASNLINRQKEEIEYWKERYERTMDNLKAILEERGDTE